MALYDDRTYATIEDIKKMTAIVNTVKPEYLEPFIQTAEQMYINNVLGTALDSELKSLIDAGTLSGVNETLVYNYIIPASVWYSFYDAAPFISIKAFSKGLVKQNSDSSTPIDREELRDYRQSILDKASFYRNRMIDYLVDNSSTFPKFRQDANDDKGRYIKKSFGGGIFLGSSSKKTYNEYYYDEDCDDC